jgi:hypothetical protein
MTITAPDHGMIMPPRAVMPADLIRICGLTGPFDEGLIDEQASGRRHN